MPTYYQLLRRSLVPVSDDKQRKMKLYSRLLAALAYELPKLLGMGAGSLLAITARRLGASIAAGPVEGFNEALKEISRKTSWSMETYSVNDSAVSVIVRDCPVRQVCMFEGLPIAETVLCRIAKGVIEGYVGKSMGVPVEAEPKAHGPNACLYLVRPRSSKRISGASRFHIYREIEEAPEEYARRVLEDLTSLASSLSELVERAAGPGAAAALRLSSKRYGGLRARLHPMTPRLEDAASLLSKELGLDVAVEAGRLVIKGCPLHGLGRELLCSSVKAFVEGFLSEATGSSVRILGVERGAGECVIHLSRR